MLAASVAYNIGYWLSRCVIKQFSNRYSYSFCLILTKLGTYDLCVNVKKTVEQIFEIFIILKFLENFLNFTFGLGLCSSSSSSSEPI